MDPQKPRTKHKSTKVSGKKIESHSPYPTKPQGQGSEERNVRRGFTRERNALEPRRERIKISIAQAWNRKMEPKEKKASWQPPSVRRNMTIALCHGSRACGHQSHLERVLKQRFPCNTQEPRNSLQKELTIQSSLSCHVQPNLGTPGLGYANSVKMCIFCGVCPRGLSRCSKYASQKPETG